MPRPKPSRARTVRITDELWEEAQAIAAERDETLSEVIRRGLQRYTARHRPQAGPDGDTK